MSAYDAIFDAVKKYFYSLGYNSTYLDWYFSSDTFCELLSMCLVRANVVNRNKSKTGGKCHQSHIAITGDSVNFFTDFVDVSKNRDDTSTVYKAPVCISERNVLELEHKENSESPTPYNIRMENGYVTLGMRTQKQIQFSKKSYGNCEWFNRLRDGLYEDDILIMLKYRADHHILCIGIPGSYFEEVEGPYLESYSRNTYLIIPRN